MSQTPYKIYDRRSSTGYSGNNRLYESVQSTGQRLDVRLLDKDTHGNISCLGRRNAISLGRWLFANCPPVRGALLEQANLAVASFIPTFYGEDEEWGDLAEEQLHNWNKICDWRGWPYDYNTWTQSLIVAEQRDGDKFTIQVSGDGGYPFIQSIPAHRVGGRNLNIQVERGPYEGLRIIDGAIIDEYGRVIAWRVESGYYDQDSYEDIPSNVMFPTFFPVWDDQIRGISPLASSSNVWQDWTESKANELIAQNMLSRLTLVESNETGSADILKNLIKTNEQRDASTNGLVNTAGEQIDAGVIRYFRAGSGSTVQAFQHDRPGTSTQQFMDTCIRDAFSGIEWNSVFALDHSTTGGAALRMVVDKIMRVIRKRQKLVEKSCLRIHGWAVSKFIKLGLLPDSPEWWKWEYQGPEEITADKKYDSEVSIMRLNNRLTTYEKECGKLGSYFEDVQDGLLKQIKRFQDEAKEAGVDLEKISIPELTFKQTAPPLPKPVPGQNPKPLT